MIAGHFGVAAAVKSYERQVPLWALMLATQWLDVVFVPLLFSRIERVEPITGTGGGYGNVLVHAGYTHSLAGACVLSALFGLMAAIPWGKRTGAVLSAVAFSHWVIDFVVHRGDMSILPGDPGALPRLGLGLWRAPGAAIAFELVLLVAGAYSYWRAATQVAAGQATRGGGQRRATLVAGFLLASGLLTLALNAGHRLG